MSHVGKLATALTVVFLVSLLILAAELLYLLLRGRRRFKTRTRVEPSAGPATQKNPDGSSADDAVVDVFKLLEATGPPSRVLCTIKEEEDVERVSLQECLESEAAAAVEDAKTGFSSSPCDSPMFYTPVGSPARDSVCSEIVSPVKTSCGG